MSDDFEMYIPTLIGNEPMIDETSNIFTDTPADAVTVVSVVGDFVDDNLTRFRVLHDCGGNHCQLFLGLESRRRFTRCSRTFASACWMATSSVANSKP